MKFEAPRKTVKKQIEETPQIAELEAHFFKNPREELKESMYDRRPGSVNFNSSNEYKTDIHTHPNYLKPSMPSFADLYRFNMEPTNSMVIAATNKEGGVVGYTFVNKHLGKDLNKKIITEDLDFIKRKIRYEEIDKELNSTNDQLRKLKSISSTLMGQIYELYRKLQSLYQERTNLILSTVEKKNWRIRFVPMKGFQFKNGYYIPKPPDQDKDGEKVPNEDEDAIRKRKKEEERQRVIRLNNQQRLRN